MDQPAITAAVGVASRLCMVVDDSRVVRKVARRILEAQGYAIQEAANGQEALAACRVALPRCVLLDWHMPIMNGMAFLQALRAGFGPDGPAVIFCTTQSELANVASAIEAGAQGYIAKPFDSAILVEKFTQLGLL